MGMTVESAQMLEQYKQLTKKLESSTFKTFKDDSPFHTYDDGTTPTPILKAPTPPIGTKNTKILTSTKAAFRSVGLICSKYLENPAENKLPIGTGVLVGPQWLLTAHHVLDSAEYATNYCVRFDYISDNFAQSEDAFKQSQRIEFAYADDAFFSSDDGTKSDSGKSYTAGDWTLIRLKTPVEPGVNAINPCRPIKVDKALINSDQNPYVVIPTYVISTQIRPQVIHQITNPFNSNYNKVVGLDGPFLMHKANAYKGASGSPLLTNEGNFLGIHVRSPSDDNINRAASAYEIAQQLKAQGFDASKEEVTLFDLYD